MSNNETVDENDYVTDNEDEHTSSQQEYEYYEQK